MRPYRTVQATLIVAFGTSFALCLAMPARAQTATDQAGRPAAPQRAATQPAPQAKKSLEIVVHGGFANSSQATKGTSALPAAGAAFTTVGGTTSRSIPSWYFGDGTKLFNDFNKNVGFPANVITPLDPALNTAATSRKSGASFGAGVAYPLNGRIAVEGNVDVNLTHLAIGSDALTTIAGSVSSFKSTFTAGLVGFSGSLVTSTSTIVDTQGQEVFATGGLRINLTHGSIVPFVTAGGGIVHRTGADTVTLVGNYQFASCGGSCPKNETDTVKITYTNTANTPALEVGGGVKGDASGKIGWRLDARAYISKNADTTSVSATPNVATAAPAVQSAISFGGNPDLQFSTITGIKSSLSGAAMTDFNTFTGTGMRVQVSVTGGITFRF